MNEIEDFYNFESRYYEKIYGSFNEDIVLYKAMSCLPPYLELFAGTGRIISKFKGGVGVEINFNMLSKSSGCFTKIQGDARFLPLKKGFNTVIIGLNSLLLVKDEEKATIISEARRVLNTGGILIVDVINGFSLRRGVYQIANLSEEGLKIKLKLRPKRDGFKYILRYRYLISEKEKKIVEKNITIYPITYELLSKMIEERYFKIEKTYGYYDFSPYTNGSEKLIVQARAI
ncbi:MAG: class I SAM-dependent methyltransferase [Thermoplasmatales archaeon]